MLDVNDPDIKALLKRPYPPRIEDVVPLAKKKGITEVSTFWQLFDELRKLYHDLKFK